MNSYSLQPEYCIWTHCKGIAEPHLQMTSRVCTDPSFVTADLIVANRMELLLNDSMNARNGDTNCVIARLPFVEIRYLPESVVPVDQVPQLLHFWIENDRIDSFNSTSN